MAKVSPISIENYGDRRIVRFPIQTFVDNVSPFENMIAAGFNALENTAAGGISQLDIPKTNDVFPVCLVRHRAACFINLVNSITGIDVNLPLSIIKFGAYNNANTSPFISTAITYDGKEYTTESLYNPLDVFIGKSGLRQIVIQNMNVECVLPATNLLVNPDFDFDTGGPASKTLRVETTVSFIR